MTQVWHHGLMAEYWAKWVAGKLVAAEDYTLRGSMYLREEILLMLKVAGFDRTLVQGDFSQEEATAAHRELVFTATLASA